MATPEELTQRRRQKILARAQVEAEQENEKLEQSPKGPSIFERYKNLKDRQKLQEKLLDGSKAVGLLIVILAYALPVEAIFSAVVVLMAGLAVRISGKSGASKGGDDFSWLGKLGGVVGKFQHVERILYVLRVIINVLCSYLMAAVLVEEVLRRGENLFAEL